jgi:hypothetical protein
MGLSTLIGSTMNFDFHYMYDTKESEYGDISIHSVGQFNWCDWGKFQNRHPDLTLLAII